MGKYLLGKFPNSYCMTIPTSRRLELSGVGPRGLGCSLCGLWLSLKSRYLYSGLKLIETSKAPIKEREIKSDT